MSELLAYAISIGIIMVSVACSIAEIFGFKYILDCQKLNGSDIDYNRLNEYSEKIISTNLLFAIIFASVFSGILAIILFCFGKEIVKKLWEEAVNRLKEEMKNNPISVDNLDQGEEEDCELEEDSKFEQVR